MSVQRRIWVPIVGFLLILGAGCFWLLAFGQARAQHEFVLSDRPPFLTEELAVAKAREFLAFDVPDATTWPVAPVAVPSAAPNGRRDEFLARNEMNPNQGTVVFRDPRGRSWGVVVLLVGNRVVCRPLRRG